MALSGGHHAHGVMRILVVEAVLGVEELEWSRDCRKAGDVDGEVGEEMIDGCHDGVIFSVCDDEFDGDSYSAD
jgi:hypothetical protein